MRLNSKIPWALAIGILAAAGALAAALQVLPGSLRASLGLAVAAEPYGCPMAEDAEVRSDGPGKCPKCGMDLVPLSQTQHKGKMPSPAGGKMATNPAREGQAEAAKGPAHEGPMAMEGKNAGHEDHQGNAAKPAPNAAQEKPEGKMIYYCPMHPSYTSDRPGDCPICNMSLVALKAEETAGESGMAGHATVTVSPEKRQLMGLRLGTAEKQPVTKTIRAAARVDYSEAGLSAVNLKFGGWVEELEVKSTGEKVKKGDPLLVIYSPELLEAQQSYLLALRARAAIGESAPADSVAFAEESLRSARERLLLWDLTPEQVHELEAAKEPRSRVKIRSRAAGVVIRRSVVQGTRVQAGTDLYEIADLSTVWVHADIYQEEIPLVSEGQEATVHLPSLPGEFISGKVIYVEPFLSEETRSVKVRIEVQNTEGKLKPGMFGTAALRVPLGEQLVVDDQAILDSGLRQVVFVDLGDGRLEPREVRTGPRADGLAVILGGLEPGERVVTSGNFLIDSESRLKSALLQGSAAAGHEHR